MTAEGWAWLVSVVAFAASMTASPGPNNAMLTASGATWGFRRTLPHMIGVSVGFPVMLAAVALGAGELLRRHPWLQEALRFGGAAYLLWLAWTIAIADPDPDAPARATSGSRPLSFAKAALFQWVNPKAWMIALGAAAAYSTGAGAFFAAQAALLAAIFFVVTLPVVAFWTLVGVGAATVLRTRRALRVFNVALAALLVASLLPLVLSR